MAKKLSVKFVEKNAKPGPKRKEIPDAALPGLYQIVQPSGSSSWAYRYRIDGRTRKLTLGSWPAVNLGEARKRARVAISKIGEGDDPAIKAQPKRAEKIGKLCEDFITIHAMHHNKRRTWVERARILGLEVDPDNPGKLRFTKSKGDVISRWQHRSVQSITGEDVIDAMDEIVARGAKVHANRVLSVISTLFSWAISRKLRSTNPCAGLKSPTKESKRRRVLKPHELRAVWRASERFGGSVGDTYRMLILSGQRLSQVCLARLEDFNLKAGVWTIPPEREGTKGDDPHVLPITAEIRFIVESCTHKRGYLFSSSFGAKPVYLGGEIKRKIDALALEELRKEAKDRGEDPAQVKLDHWTNHDLRRTMRTGLSALAVPLGDLTRELVIGHKQGGVHDVYDQHLYMDEKKVALELWAAKVRDTVSTPPDNVHWLKVAS